MRPDDLREATREAAQKGTHKLTKHLSKGEKKNRKRMATVATVYTVAPYVRTPEQITRSLAPLHEAAPARPKVENKRVWASLAPFSQTLARQGFGGKVAVWRQNSGGWASGWLGRARLRRKGGRGAVGRAQYSLLALP
jgi:hypothetical protein